MQALFSTTHQNGPEEGVTVLWTLETRRLPKGVQDRWRAVLDEEEAATADRFLRDNDRRESIAAHALRRALLSAAFGNPPDHWRFTRREPFGKPQIVPSGSGSGQPECDVSLTHTVGLVAAVIGRGQRVGVDAESLARPTPVDDLIPTVLTANEAAAVGAHAIPARRAQAFLERWVVKEAVAKLLGLGITRPLDRIETRGNPPRVVLRRPWPSLGSGLGLRLVRPTPSHTLAIAATRASTGLPALIWRHLDTAALDRALLWQPEGLANAGES